MRKFYNYFLKNEHGVVAIVLAMCLVPIIFAILALTIDLGRVQSESSNNVAANRETAFDTANWILATKVEKLRRMDENWAIFAPEPDEIFSYAKIAYSQKMGIPFDSKLITKFEASYADATHCATIHSCLEVENTTFAAMLNLGNSQNTCAANRVCFDLPLQP